MEKCFSLSSGGKCYTIVNAAHLLGVLTKVFICTLGRSDFSSYISLMQILRFVESWMYCWILCPQSVSEWFFCPLSADQLEFTSHYYLLLDSISRFVIRIFFFSDNIRASSCFLFLGGGFMETQDIPLFLELHSSTTSLPRSSEKNIRLFSTHWFHSPVSKVTLFFSQNFTAS